MKGVTQDMEGDPWGSCVQASYATIFSLPLEAVPPLSPGVAKMLGAEQGDCERAWLATLGLGLVEISVDPEDTMPQEVLDCMPEVPHLMSGLSPRGYGHRCVGVGGKLVWDPHWSRAGLVSIYSVGILVPL